MKLEENVRITKLYDSYGKLLSLAQQEVVEQMLFYDLSGSEIAENKNISRQAVKDAFSKAVKKLEEYEVKLGFIRKLEKLEKEIISLKGRKS